MRHPLTCLIMVLAAVSPAAAETLFCAPVAMAEVIGEAGAMTISASDPALGNPTVFWLDTASGQVQEHYDQGAEFIIDEFVLVGRTERSVYEGSNESQDEIYRVDLSITVHPYQRSVNAALTEIGVCVPSSMGEIPTESAAPIWPFPYSATNKTK